MTRYEMGVESTKDLDDKFLHALCIEWVQWIRSKRLFVQPTPKGILARMQPSKSSEVPDAPLNPEIAFFNIAVEGMENDIKKHCFIIYYLKNVKGIKNVANDLQISRQSFYVNVKKFRREVYKQAKFLQKVHVLHGKKDDLVIVD